MRRKLHHLLMNFLGLAGDESVQPAVSEPTKSRRKMMLRELNMEQPSSAQNVINLPAMKPSAKVIICEPECFEDVYTIAEQIAQGSLVVFTLDRVQSHEQQRMVDFLYGVMHALEGEIQALNAVAWLCAPADVYIDGSIQHWLPKQFQSK